MSTKKTRDVYGAWLLFCLAAMVPCLAYAALTRDTLLIMLCPYVAIALMLLGRVFWKASLRQDDTKKKRTPPPHSFGQ